jgi:ABC-type antimicrobial peptide transport system permease subunit
MAVHVRLDAATGEVARNLRSAMATADAELPVGSVVDVREALARSMGETRTFGYLVTVFAGLALFLAAIGLYGLISFGVSQRVRELGIRMALGARPDALVRLVLVRGLAIATLGVIAGLGLSFLIGQALDSLLFGVAATDPGTLAGAAVLLLATAALAAWIPARRASRVDAAVSLRNEG